MDQEGSKGTIQHLNGETVGKRPLEVWKGRGGTQFTYACSGIIIMMVCVAQCNYSMHIVSLSTGSVPLTYTNDRL